MLKMASSADSVEERQRLQGRVRTQRYRDRQNEDARARRRQSDRDRWRAARQRATEAQRCPQEPPEEKSVCTAVRFNKKISRSMLLCVCVFFDRATRLSHLRLRAASNCAQETSEQTYVMIVVYATIHYAIQLNSVTLHLNYCKSGV